MNKIELGIEPPAQFLEQPEILPHNQFYWEAFGDLSTERQIGMGLGPIPRSAIQSYAKEFGITGDEYEIFQRIIRKMDNKYLEMSSSRKPRDDKGLVAPADDPERTRAVMDVIRARAKAATKKQRKQRMN